MHLLRKLPDVNEIVDKYSLSETQRKERKLFIEEFQNILSGKSTKKVICIGPCSADREDAVVEYVERLAKLQEELKEAFLLIPRVYTSKPRTNGMGYKGLLHRPSSECSSDDLLHGLIAMRKMHLHVIQQTGLFPADEMLYPEMINYVMDLLSYVTVGARSVEDQGHRLVASGMEAPVGMKNPIGGNLDVLLNSINAAQFPQSLIFNGWEAQTDGNPYTHAILRGYTDINGKMHPNYYYENICDLHDRYKKANLKNPAVVVDCNHGNSLKRYDEQGRIASDLFQMCRRNKEVDRFVKGIMIESYLEDGCQMIGEGHYGKSITDACLGWKKTEKLLRELREYL